MKNQIRFLVFCLIALFYPKQGMAQQVESVNEMTFVDTIGAKAKYAATIEMKRGYVSGICMLAVEEDCYRMSLFNEFGISALDFTYQKSTGKVKLQHVIKMLDKWYIRKVLKQDLAKVVVNLMQGKPTYMDEKYQIKYQFQKLNDTTDLESNDATEE